MKTTRDESNRSAMDIRRKEKKQDEKKQPKCNNRRKIRQKSDANVCQRITQQHNKAEMQMVKRVNNKIDHAANEEKCDNRYGTMHT